MAVCRASNPHHEIGPLFVTEKKEATMWADAQQGYAATFSVNKLLVPPWRSVIGSWPVETKCVFPPAQNT
jgi:hypothetical protein